MASTQTISADGNSNGTQWNGGFGEFYANGTFGAGTLSLQRSDDNSTNWTTIGIAGNQCQLSANGTIGFSASPCFLRINMTGSTSPSVVVGYRRISPPV